MKTHARTAALSLGAACACTLALAPSARAWAAPLDEGALGSSLHLDAAPSISSSADGVAAFADIMARLFLFGLFLNEADQAPRRGFDDAPAAVASRPEDAHAQYEDWERPRRRVQRDAREGFLFSFGLGGGSMHVSPEGRAGSFQGNLRFGYGFSDRFQLFFDLTGAGVVFNRDQSAASWLFTMRGQTVLIGDRKGNGLNLNLGLGLGGTTKSSFGIDTDYPAGFAVAGGLSFDIRLTPHFALEPEIFYWWHSIPNSYGRDHDISTAVGMQLNFQWYGP
jgi:hypothetical protein